VRKVRYGMVGGGEGAFIGAVHRTAAAIAGNLELVAGAFSSDPERSRRSGAAIGVPSERAYGSWAEMIDQEMKLPADARIEAVSIVTPNHVHAGPAIAAFAAGLHVICDKPIAESLESGRAIVEAAERSGKVLAITHTYTGYPLVKQARALVAGGALGQVRRVHVQYLQDWLSRAEDTKSNKQSAWRTDPAQSGEAGAFGDIGTHAFNLVEFITGQRITRLACELRAVIPGRTLDDDGAAMFKLADGASGLLSASQVCTGDVNALKIAVYCDEAGLHWAQENPNELWVQRRGAPKQLWEAGVNKAYLGADAIAVSRTPGGHPEGYLEAFANIYRSFAQAVRGENTMSSTGEPGFATAADALAGMRFIRAARKSSEAGASWVDMAAIG
jgi:predicted dehydrogenase